MKSIAMVLVLLGVAGCGAPVLQLRSGPPVPSLAVQPLARPSAVSLSDSGGEAVQVQQTAAHEPPDLRAQTVAIIVNGGDAERALSLQALPRLCIAAGFTRVLYPSALQVQGTLEYGAVGASNRTTITGPLPQLALLQAATPADALLVIELSTSVTQQSRNVSYRIEPEAMAAYRQRYQGFLAALERAQHWVTHEGATYSGEIERTEGRYQRAGGLYESPQDRNLQAYAAGWTSAYQALRARIGELRGQAIAPDDVEHGAAAQHGQQTVSITVAHVRGVLTDLRAGETYWLADVTAQGDSQDAAMRLALERLIHDLGGAASAAHGHTAAGQPSMVPTTPAPATTTASNHRSRHARH